MEKIKKFLNELLELFKTDPKKFTAIGAGLTAFILAIVIIFSLIFTNNYKTPIKTMQKYDNKKTYYSVEEKSIALHNGFCAKEVKAIYKLYESNKDYKENQKALKEDFDDIVSATKEVYGKNYKYTYKIADKEKLDKTNLNNFKNQLINYADDIENKIENTNSYTEADWKNYANESGFNGDIKKAKKHIKLLKKVAVKYKNAEVSAGYALATEIKLKRKGTDTTESNAIFNVYKVDGKWVPSNITTINAFK